MANNTTINERLATVESKIEENNKTTWRVFEAIYGNGKPGLLAEFISFRQSLDALKKSLSGHQNGHTQKKLDWQWLVTVIVALAAVIVAIIK